MSKNKSEVIKPKLVYINPYAHSLLKAEAMLQNSSIRETLENIIMDSVSDMAKLIANNGLDKSNKQKVPESSDEYIDSFKQENEIEEINDKVDDIPNKYINTSKEEIEIEEVNDEVDDIPDEVLQSYRR